VSDPRPDELVKFIDALTETAPDGYEPWLFRCEHQGKDPKLSYGSWKDESARMTVDEAVDWMRGGGNVGIAATADGPLVNVDVDDDEATTLDDVKDTLLVRSRSRTGFHAIYFEAEDSDEVPNIPTENAGEVRANWQYVVAPGSYVPADDPEALPPEKQDLAGYYTVLEDRPPARISLEELPQVFLDYHQQGGEADVDRDDMPGTHSTTRDAEGTPTTHRPH
jgi:Bifunctional DNA primase/polymerase, N-terminal.